MVNVTLRYQEVRKRFKNFFSSSNRTVRFTSSSITDHLQLWIYEGFGFIQQTLFRAC